MEMGFENCEVGFEKKMNWEMLLLKKYPLTFRKGIQVTLQSQSALKQSLISDQLHIP